MNGKKEKGNDNKKWIKKKEKETKLRPTSGFKIERKRQRRKRKEEEEKKKLEKYLEPSGNQKKEIKKE